jgi:hypothetical protein
MSGGQTSKSLMDDAPAPIDQPAAAPDAGSGSDDTTAPAAPADPAAAAEDK